MDWYETLYLIDGAMGIGKTTFLTTENRLPNNVFLDDDWYCDTIRFRQ